jgi:hypothetical protein
VKYPTYIKWGAVTGLVTSSVNNGLLKHLIELNVDGRTEVMGR